MLSGRDVLPVQPVNGGLFNHHLTVRSAPLLLPALNRFIKPLASFTISVASAPHRHEQCALFAALRHNRRIWSLVSVLAFDTAYKYSIKAQFHSLSHQEDCTCSTT